MNAARSTRRQFLAQSSLVALGGAAAWSRLGNSKAGGSVVPRQPPLPDYGRFTDRARKVMHLAASEAIRFDGQHLGTEHILLGLLKEGRGVGAHVLKGLGVDLRTARREIKWIVHPAPSLLTPQTATMTPRAKNVIAFSSAEAGALNHSYVGTEHLLLGLLREPDGVAAQVLTNLHLRLADVRDEVLNLLGYGLS